jgi:putative ABC transport system permease protein
MRYLDHLQQDLAFAFRALRKDRGFTLSAVLILGLGIGAQGAVFSLVNGILLRPLEYREPGRLYAVEEVIPRLTNQYPSLPVNGRHYLRWVKQCTSCDSISLINNYSEVNLSGTGDPERLTGEIVTTNYFAVLGVGTQIGRTFTAEDGREGHQFEAIISDALWHRKFGGDASVVGRSVVVNDQPHTIIGVLPPWFRAPAWAALGEPMQANVDIFQPWAIKESEWEDTGSFDYGSVLRLKPGATEQQARAELDVIEGQIAASVTGDDHMDFVTKLTPLQTIETKQSRSGLLLLLGAVGTVMLIVCVNLGNLMVGRALRRTRETAVRIALGAPRGRLLRGVIAESLLLAIAGGALGIGIAEAVVRLFVSFAPSDLPRLSEVHVDSRVLTFAIGAALISGLLFGFIPAWRTTRVDPQEAMRSGSRSSTESGGRMRLRELLVSVEVGLSCLLLIIAGLLLTSFARLMNVDTGFQAQHVLTAQISPSRPRYDDAAKRARLYHDVAAKLQTEPGVTAAGLISVSPLNGQLWTDIISVPGDTRPMMERPISSYRPITPDYFRAMGIRTIAGRTATDTDEPRRLAVVSQHTADVVWPGQDPVGKQFRRGDPKETPYEIIGVVSDVRSASLQEAPGLMVYVPYWTRPSSFASLVVRTSGDPAAMADAIRAAVWSVDSQLPVSRIETMDHIEDRSLSQKRFQTALLLLFAGSALLLAALGTYGVLSFSVAQRTNEFGVRMSLGAQPKSILRLAMLRGLVPVAIGAVAGLGGALAVGRLVSGLLFGVSPYDWKTVAGVMVVTGITAVCACWVPARRATRVDPLDALRYE